jgi:AraC-like DNA-binding protein
MDRPTDLLINKEITSYKPIYSPIESISGVWRFVRPAGHRVHTHSLPDHLLQLVLQGSYAIRINNRHYEVKAGDVIYFYANEDVQWLGNPEEVTFYSVGFRSLVFRPLAIDQRIFASTPTLRKAFEQLYSASRLPRHSEGFAMGTYSALLTILLEIQHTQQPTESVNARTQSWWELEKRIRGQGRFRPGLDELAQLCFTSRATVVRLCRQATGLSPMQRIRQIRMEEAKGLLSYSPMNITEIARYLGYDRIHEFSREFTAYYGTSPRQFRK